VGGTVPRCHYGSFWSSPRGRLPDDSREEDERAPARQLHEARARVNASRAMVTTTPGLAETLANDLRKATIFYIARGITEEMFSNGVPAALLLLNGER
jgi:hypothetical protein